MLFRLIPLRLLALLRLSLLVALLAATLALTVEAGDILLRGHILGIGGLVPR